MNDYANITQITLLVRKLDIGTKVIRVRQHSQENQLFKYRKDLSYPPKEKVKLARANMDGQPMFYGAVFSNFCINDNPRLTCLFETNREVLDDTFVGKELSRHFSLTGEKKEEENSYAYTADFTTHLFKTHPEIDGIIYPSARLKEEGIGVNVAIRPEVIDNAFELKACSVCRYFKRNKKQQLILNYKHSRFRQNGKIYYVIDREFYRDLDFKNTEYDFKTLQFKY